MVNKNNSKSNKLRLLLFPECNRSCEGCCNKQWDLNSIPKCEDFSEYSTIMLTGGEPMLRPEIIIDTIVKIREQNENAKIILYTAMVEGLSRVIPFLDGLTLTLHDPLDIKPFEIFDQSMIGSSKFSLRLNVFEEVNYHDISCKNNWQIKNNIQWIENCPLPEDEVFMRL